MEQHPVPQQISAYRFKLVGDMTLKQFLEIATGVVIAVVIYSSGLHFIIKWPLILISVIIGGALAFVPFEERPLERWIFAFFRSIYSPTIFNWKKALNSDVLFQQEENLNQEAPIAQTQTIEVPSEKNLEQTEKQFLSNVKTMLQNPPSNPVAVSPQVQNQTGTILTETVQKAPVPVVEEVQPIIKEEVKKDVSVPDQNTIKVEPTQKYQNQNNAAIPLSNNITANQNPQTVYVSGVTNQTNPTNNTIQNAQFDIKATPPMAPSTINTISGQVLGSDGKIVDGAILEIRDNQGRPARAVRTNRAGHFLITIPFPNGIYEIITEKENHEFDTVKFEAKGEIIPPIIVIAKK